jgi:hypothetical protein
MRTFSPLEKAILKAAADSIAISPAKADAITACDAMVTEGLLKRVRHGTYENTEKGERAFHHAFGNGAAYDRVSASCGA